jgi:pseudolysin
MYKFIQGLTAPAVIVSGFLISSTSIFAATPVDLKHQSASILSSFSTLTHQSQFNSVRSETDINQTQHIHMQQTYAGYPVWGGDFIMHIPQGHVQSLNEINRVNNNDISMNGIIYQNLEKDLHPLPSYADNDAQMDKAIQQAIMLYQKQSGYTKAATDQHAKKIVFVDKNNQAHWAFLISFVIKNPGTVPVKPTYIMDAVTLAPYKQWNDIKTELNLLGDALGGGYGGNKKSGQVTYDGLPRNLPKLNVMRESSNNTCYLQNTEVTVRDVSKNGNIIQFICANKDNNHDYVYWNTNNDAVNGAFSPSNDALYVGKVVKDMYQYWYSIPVLEKGGKPMMLNMQVHATMDNAYWDGNEMFFGDGVDIFYPLVSLGVGAHEISHGFTEQHSDLAYYDQSGGLNESFSDMAAQAADYYIGKKNNWKIGEEIFKEKNKALRYMKEPTKDCYGKQPGDQCSISNAKDYSDSLDVHYSSGVFNKFFYLLSTSKKWDTQKAFNVMVTANLYYWTSNTNFTDAACGVLKAAKDYRYPTKTVIAAAKKVGIDVTAC